MARECCRHGADAIPVLNRVIECVEVLPREAGVGDDPSCGRFDLQLDVDRQPISFDCFEVRGLARRLGAHVDHSSLIRPDVEVAASLSECVGRSCS
jgi:hypothetical protein